MGAALLKNIFTCTKLKRSVFLGFSYGLGQGILAQIILFIGALGGRFEVHTILKALLIVGLVFYGKYYFGLKKNSFMPEENLLDASTTETGVGAIFKGAVVLCFSLYVAMLFWKAWYWPIWGWDSMATSVFNAKVFFYEGSLENLKYVPHAPFPLQIPFSILWLNLNLGQWHDEYIKIIFPLVFLSFAAIQHYFLKYYTNSFWASLGLLFFLSASLITTHATSSYRDLFLLYYNCSVLISLMLWHDSQDNAWLILGGLLSGFGIFTKLEGLPYFLIHSLLLITCLFKQKKPLKVSILAFIKFTLPGLVIFLFFYMYKSLSGILMTEKTHMNFSGIFLDRVGWILQRFLEDLFWTSNWSIIWFLLCFAILLHIRVIKNCFRLQFLLGALVLFFGVPFSTSLIVHDASHILSRFTLSRIFLHFFPISIWLIIFIYYRVITGSRQGLDCDSIA